MILREELEAAHKIGRVGAALIEDEDTVLTHCNAGSLATAGYGTALAVLWNPQVSAPGFTGGRFGFNFTVPTNATIVVEASANLQNPAWLPVATNVFEGKSDFFALCKPLTRTFGLRRPLRNTSTLVRLISPETLATADVSHLCGPPFAARCAHHTGFRHEPLRAVDDDRH